MSKSKTWIVLAITALVAGAIFAAGCGGDDDGGSGDTIKEGELLVGTDTPFPPFEIGQPPDISGYDIDVMDAIAEDLDLTAKYEDTSFDTIFRDTANGRFDIAAAASTITPAREKVVTFSTPYYEAQQALVVQEGSDITSTKDLSGAIVGAQDATTGETYANDETDASEVRGFPEGPDAITAVRTGQVDAAIIDQPVAADAVDKQGGIEIAEEIQTDELYGFAMALDAPLVSDVDDALDTLKEDGTIDDLYEKYFKTDPPDSVLNPD